jgi:glucose/mannose transport system permease protein
MSLGRHSPQITMAPIMALVAVVFVGGLIWTVAVSFTGSRSMPDWKFVGLDNWDRLFTNARWGVSMTNMGIFGVCYIGGCLAFGYLMAIFIDQKVRAEGVFRTIFLCPHALSFIITGAVWQWYMNPTLGIQKFVRDHFYPGFDFAWTASQKMAIYAVVLAAIWHGAGLVMVLLLAGLRGIDGEIWKATRVDGVPTWRTNILFVLPMLGPAILTAIVLLGAGVVKNYDLVIAMTGGGPGISTDVPAKFVMENLLERGNIALATAGAVMMLVIVAAIAAPALYWRALQERRRADRMA